MPLDPSPLTVMRETLATGLAAALEIPNAYAAPKTDISLLPALLIHPGGHDDYIGESETFGGDEVAVALLFHQHDNELDARLAQLEVWYTHLPAALRSLEDDLAAVGVYNAAIVRRTEPRLVTRPGGKPRMFTGQADLTFLLPDPDC